MCFDLVAGCKHVIEFKAANNVANNQNTREQREATAAGYRQRHPGAPACVLFVAPEADQQE